MKAIRILFICLFLLISTLSIQADEPTNVSVSIKTPESQVDNITGYFDLMLKPSETDKLTLTLSNPHDYEVLVTIDVVNGATGINGGPVYDKSSQNDESLINPLTSLISGSNTLRLKGKESKNYSATITAPENNYQGEILGAFVVSSRPIDEEEDKQESISFENLIEYAVAVRVRMTDIEVERNLNLLTVGSKTHDYLPVFYATIQNDRAFHMGNVSISGLIKDSKDNVVASVNTSGTQILPNTYFNVHFSLLEPEIKAGTYSMELEIHHRTDVWSWNESIIVEKKDSDKINEEAIFTEKKIDITKIMIGIIGVLILLILFLLLLLLKRRKNEEEDINRH